MRIASLESWKVVEVEAQRMLANLKERLAKFKLTLHEQKTRLIESGKLVSELRRKRGADRCETFTFLGFTHYCGWSRDGRFVVKRRTDHLRLTRKLKELRVEARRRMHTPIVLQYQWLCSVLRGHFVYFGLPSNLDRIHAFYRETSRLWYRALNRRNQRRFSWEQFVRLLKRFPLPTASITHPRPVVAG
jgi:RNA-directed DNA polymerase